MTRAFADTAPASAASTHPPLSGPAGAALLGLAALVLWAAGFAPPGPASMILTSAGLASAAGGVAILWLGRPSRRRSITGDASFDAIARHFSAPSALTDDEGRVINVNAAMAGDAPSPDGETMVARFIGRWTADAPAVCYRLLQRCAADGAATETLFGTEGAARVEVSRAAPDRLLWWVFPAVAEAAPPSQSPDAIFEALPVAIARLDTEGRIISANAPARALLGASATPGARIGELVEGLGRSMEARVAEARRGDSSGRPEIARGDTGGREVFLQVSLTRADLDGGPCLLAVMSDATELKTLEAQFVQSQKMQAVGQLAGGVAHDFNNLLTAIAGHTDLLLHRHEHGDLDYADLTQIRQNANRAAGLVRQLLAFSRKQTLRPTVVNLIDTLSETSHLLNRLLGERVTLTIEHAESLGLVKVDERQFEQVVMNLVVNARDAMPKGGSVAIRTSNVRIESEQRRGRAVMPKGDYVQIEIVDQGMGIPNDKLDQIFEPFFTTKRAGEGTGLGLSTVYGIVKQTGGFIFAESVVGEGSTFTILLPRHAPTKGEIRPVAAPPPAPTDLTGRGVVMLIEDETPVRAFAARALKLRGYQVVEAASGEEALEILSDPALEIDIVVSDVVMPGMDGPACVREARKMRPDVRVIFVSGYAEDALKRSMEGVGDCRFLPKPFSLNELTAKVKESLSS